MASTTNSSTPPTNNTNINPNNSPAESPAESTAAKSVQKRYEGLVMVRTKAVKGKGAWYWAHLEPILIQNPDSGFPKAVKLRCSLCDAVFSASNPSRTASEHLKRGTCPNFNSAGENPAPTRPISVAGGRKRPIPISSPSPLSMIEPAPIPISIPMSLSGGKDDLRPLAMLEDSVKRLKSPKTNPGPALSRAQVDSAVELLSDWVYESCGSVSLSSLNHPKFKAFLNQVGVPGMISRQELVGPRLDSRFDEARAESDARIRDAMFFQLAAHGWSRAEPDRQSLVSLSVNLPNGTSVYRRAVFVQPGSAGSRFAENVMWETAVGICGTHSAAQRCAGIVSDRFKSKALRNLESQNPWMVNLPCQSRAFRSLLSDFFRNLPLMKSISAEIASFLDRKSPDFFSPESAFSALTSILSSPRDSSAMDPTFWPRAEAAHSLAKLTKDFAGAVEHENPLVSRCLPLWDELRAKVREWRMKHRHASESDDDEAERIAERRFRKNYRPVWAAAFVLDPLYLVRDSSGKYLPPFKCLTGDQEKDVDRLITRLVARDEAHIALMELMKWRAEGLDPVYARAVQMRERDPQTGAMRVANPQSSRLVWETHLTHFSALPKVAVRLIFLRATAGGPGAAFEDSPLLRWVTPAGAERAQKLVFVAAHSRSSNSGTENRCGDDEDARILANEEHGLENKHIVAKERPP